MACRRRGCWSSHSARWPGPIASCWLSSIYPQSKRHLDFGARDGDFVRHLVDRGVPAPALEPSPARQTVIANRLNRASLQGLFDPGTAARGARRYLQARTCAVPQPTGTAPGSNSAGVRRRSAVESQILSVFLTSDHDEGRIPPVRSASAPARRCSIMSPWVGCGNTGGDRTGCRAAQKWRWGEATPTCRKGEESGGSRGQLGRFGLRCLPLFRWSIGG